MTKHGDCPDCPILTGEAAKRFNDYLENPPPLSEEARELIREVRKMAQEKPNPHVPGCTCDKYNTCADCLGNEQIVRRNERKLVYDNVVSSVKHLIREEGYYCGESQNILEHLKALRIKSVI